MLLSEGHVMYYGCAQMANDWFNDMDFPCTFGMNIADFILDLANGEVWYEVRWALVDLSLFFWKQYSACMSPSITSLFRSTFLSQMLYNAGLQLSIPCFHALNHADSP